MVAFVGKPNAGKSTLMNRIVGDKLSIVSPKPQTTRDRVVGIRTTDDAQMVILDTPGLLDPAYPLQEAMREAALRAQTKIEAAKHGIFSSKRGDGAKFREPSLVAAVSARTGEGVQDLVETIESLLPESPFLYPTDEISAQPVRFFAAELIRETALEQLRDEVPYSIACEIEEFREDRSPRFIRAIIYVEKESQKGIVVGANGAAIKRIGEQARKKIEAFIGEKVYLELHVKVLPNWRRDSSALSRFGYQIKKGKAQ